MLPLGFHRLQGHAIGCTVQSPGRFCRRPVGEELESNAAQSEDVGDLVDSCAPDEFLWRHETPGAVVSIPLEFEGLGSIQVEVDDAELPRAEVVHETSIIEIDGDKSVCRDELVNVVGDVEAAQDFGGREFQEALGVVQCPVQILAVDPFVDKGEPVTGLDLAVQLRDMGMRDTRQDAESAL